MVATGPITGLIRVLNPVPSIPRRHLKSGQALAACLIGLALLTTLGCGGGEADTPANPPLSLQQLNQPEAQAAPVEPAEQPKEEPKPEAPPMEEPAETELPAEEQPPEKRERPEDFAEWTLEEFRDAHTEDDRRFKEALLYLGENKVGDTDTAALLSDLLVYHEPEIEPPPETDDERELKRYEQQKEMQLRKALSSQTKYAQQIIETLALIGTDNSFDTLSKILAGTLNTGLDQRKAPDAALKALLTMDDNKVQGFVYTAITAPDQLRTNDDGSFPPEELQKRVLRELPTVATHELRTKLGEYAAQAGPQDAAFQDLWRTLSEPRADNLRAQLLLYLSPQLEERESDQLRRQFVEHSRHALNELLGVPEDAQAARSRSSHSGGFGGFGRSFNSKEYEDDADLTYEVARVLWSLQFLGAVSQEMQDFIDLNQSMPTVELIGAMPVVPIRQEVEGYLDDHWDEVAEQSVSKLPERLADALQDPGLLLVLKDVPRRRDPQVRSERRNGPSSTTRRTRPAPRANDPRQMRDESQYIWMDTTEMMVRALNARMFAAATAEQTTTDGEPTDGDQAEEVAAAEEPSPPDEQPADAANDSDAESETETAAANGLPAGFELPYELNEGANVVATHHVRWPDDVQDRIKDQTLAPLEVFYVRLECEDILTKVASHYQGQLGHSQTRFLENEGRWLDLTEELDTGWNRSADVFIQRAAAENANTNDEEESRRRVEPEPLVVEILVVATEVPQPAEESDTEEAESGDAAGN